MRHVDEHGAVDATCGSACCLLFAADPEHQAIKVGEFSEKIALVRADDDEGLEDEYTVCCYGFPRKHVTG